MRLVELLRAALASAACLLSLPASAQEAWWLTARFTPAHTSYEGLTASDIDPNWRSFSVLTYGALPREAQADLGWMRKEGFSFAKEGDFNRNGRRDRAVAGVYVDGAGRSGRFLLVLERQGDRWRKVFLHSDPGDAGFSVIFGRANEVHWSHCMECDAGYRLRPRGSTYELIDASR